MINDSELKVLKTLNILYLEDENNIREYFSSVLKMFFNSVYDTDSASKAFNIFRNNKIDIILSDISMPELSGIEFVKKIRLENKHIPIIFLTAYTDTEILVEATKLKLVDYLIKPISLEDLKNTLLNAALELNQYVSKVIEFGDNIEYNIEKKQLFINGEAQGITNKEISLLLYLYSNKERTVSKDEIKLNIWEDEFEATDSAFKSVLNKLRSKIGKDSIKNISGVGYQLIIAN